MATQTETAGEVGAEAIATLFTQRQKDSEPVLQRMRRVRDAYNGDLVVALPDIEAASGPAVANLILSGIDQTAGRIASVVPQVTCPPTKPGDRASERRALTRQKAILGWWQTSGGKKLLRERARYLVSYGSAPATIRPNYRTKQPEWAVRNPLTVLPNLDLADTLTPADTIVQINRPFAWLRDRYPDAAMALPKETRGDQQVVLIEYNDYEQTTLLLTGLLPNFEPGQVTAQWDSASAGGMYVVLESYPNRAGVPLTVLPSRTTLDKTQGQFDQTIGLYQAQARLGALELDAVEKGIYPDTYFVANPGETPQFISGPHDGRSGDVNIVSGGRIESITSQPTYMAGTMNDRLERGQRMSGIPAEFGGESATNVRTGRRGDSIMSATIDIPIAEAQDALAEALREENRRAAQVALTAFGSTTTSFYLTLSGKPTQVTYTPKQIFAETDENRVSYPVSGADANSLVIGMGQRLGLGTLSRKSFMENDPLIDDAEAESDRINSESMEEALRTSFLNAAAAGQVPVEVVARVNQLIRTDKADLADAIMTAQTEAAEAQASASGAEAEAINGLQGLVPGAAGGPVGAPGSAPPSVAEPSAGLANLAGTMNALRNSGSRSATRAVTA